MSKQWFEQHQKILLKFINFRIFGIYPFRYLFFLSWKGIARGYIWCYKKPIAYFGDSYFQSLPWIVWACKKCKRKANQKEYGYVLKAGECQHKNQIPWRYQTLYAYSGLIHAKVLARIFRYLQWLFYIPVLFKPQYTLPMLALPTDTFSPASGANSPVDGYHLHSITSETTWGAAHDATNDSTNNNTGNDLIADVDAANGVNYYSIYRGVLCANTGAIPDGNTIDSGFWRCLVNAKPLAVDDARSYIVFSKYTGDEPTLATGGYSAYTGLPTITAYSSTVTITSTTVGSTSDWTLNANGRGNISKTGVDKFGFNTGHDAENTAPARTAATSTGIQFDSADKPAGTAALLSVTHSAPVTSAYRRALMGMGA